MAKCSTKGCKAGAVARIEEGVGTKNKKSRPVCGTCASKITTNNVKLNDNVKVSSTEMFAVMLRNFAEAQGLNYESLEKLIADKEFGVLDEIAIADTGSHLHSFSYQNMGITYVVYIGPVDSMKQYNVAHAGLGYVKYRANPETVSQLFNGE